MEGRLGRSGVALVCSSPCCEEKGEGFGEMFVLVKGNGGSSHCYKSVSNGCMRDKPWVAFGN